MQRVCDRVAIIREERIVRTQDVAELAASAVKRVSIELAGGAAADAGTLGHLGAQDIETDGAHASFLFSGGANALTHALAGLDLANVDVSEPSLEEVFLRYYGNGEDAASDTGSSDGAGAKATGTQAAGPSDAAAPRSATPHGEA